MKYTAPILAAALAIATVTIVQAEPLYPEVANISYATPEVAAFFKSYFTAKSQHKPVATTDHFSEAHLTYIDAALGWPFYSKKAMTDLFEQYMPKWPPGGLSYPTRISGDMNSTVVAFTDTPELFGGEIRILAAIDFKDPITTTPFQKERSTDARVISFRGAPLSRRYQMHGFAPTGANLPRLQRGLRVAMTDLPAPQLSHLGRQIDEIGRDDLRLGDPVYRQRSIGAAGDPTRRSSSPRIGRRACPKRVPRPHRAVTVGRV
jgi:hypothetical protein